MNKRKNIYFSIITGWRKIVMSSFLVLALLGNTIMVYAEETTEDYIFDSVETVVIDDVETALQYDIKDNVDVGQEFYVGQNFDVNMVPLADEANTDFNNARIIQVNSLVNDAITEEGQQRWYAFAANAGKLTLNLNFEGCGDVDYDIYLYQYNDEHGVISRIDGMATTKRIEHFSRMVDAGIYFVLVNGYSGCDVEHVFTLGTVLSVYYDEQEVDDRLQDAFNLTTQNYSVTGTIDNQFDMDIQQYSVSDAGRMYFTLRNNGSSKNIYAMELLDSYGNTLATLNQNTKYNVDLPKGIYFFKVFCSTFGSDYSSTYTLSGDIRRSAAKVKITHAGDAPRPIEDYKDGPYWRVTSTSYVSGTAYDANGYLLPNADIVIRVTTQPNDLDVYANGKTDSQGNFRIQLNLGGGYGTYMYSTGISRHYYDIVPVSFLSNGKTIPADVDYFYHLAYQIKT